MLINSCHMTSNKYVVMLLLLLYSLKFRFFLPFLKLNKNKYFCVVLSQLDLNFLVTSSELYYSSFQLKSSTFWNVYTVDTIQILTWNLTFVNEVLWSEDKLYLITYHFYMTQHDHTFILTKQMLLSCILQNVSCLAQSKYTL